jgi:hypothetical protein
VKSGRQAIEEKEEKRKDEKKGETRKKQGLTFNFCSIFSANKICRTWEKKVQEPIKRVTKMQGKEKARNRRKYKTEGKGFKLTNTDQATITLSTLLHLLRLHVCSLHLLHAFFSLCLHGSGEF